MLDLRCYLVTGDSARAVDVARQAALGGAGVVQVRSKPISARALYALAEEVSTAVAQANPSTKVLIDDRVDIAWALMHRGLPVHGVHLGQDDLDVRAARELLGPDAIIGLTTGTLELVHRANEQADVIDYIGAGPFRPTPTKDSGRDPLGVDGYFPLVEASRVPVVAIGDVTAADAFALAPTGVAGLAVCRGLMDAADPAAYAAELLRGFTS